MFDWIRDFLSSGPKMMWVATVKNPGFVTSATFGEREYSKKYDYSYELKLHFAEPARDGNDIAAINFKNDSGGVMHIMEVAAGTETGTLYFNEPEEDIRELDFVTVTTDDTVYDSSTITISKEPVEPDD